MKQKTMMVADVIDRVAKGRIGHREAMDRLGLENYAQLLDTMHANGKSMWAHKAARSNAETMALLALACGVALDPSKDLSSGSAPLREVHTSSSA